jgi:hypothetical protein
LYEIEEESAARDRSARRSQVGTARWKDPLQLSPVAGHRSPYQYLNNLPAILDGELDVLSTAVHRDETERLAAVGWKNET